MRKLFLISLLIFVGVASRASFAREQTNAQTRSYKKAARKAQKDMVKYSKQQQKAMKKSAKAQRKALKKAQQRRTTY